MGKIIAWASILLLLGCGAYRHAGYVRDGILRQGIHREGFINAWGPPDRTKILTVGSDTGLSVDWNQFGGSLRKGRKTLQEWEYSQHNIRLLFNGDYLVDWKTDKTVTELRLIADAYKPARTHLTPAEQ